jgi:hydrogenase maturation protease
MESRVLVAGIGNIFFGDDAFGVEVVARLARRPPPEDFEVVDFGIRGLDLVYALEKPHDLVILIDAMPRGGVPGTLYVVEPTIDELRDGPDLAFDAHRVDPLTVLRMAIEQGACWRRLVLVGCEPSPLDAEGDFVDGLSAPVAAAVDEGVRIIESMVQESLPSPLESQDVLAQ